MPESRPEFQRVQRQFAAHIREPKRHPPPADVAPNRMAMYRELFFNNIENFIATGFPVLKSILAGERWLALVDGFYARHRCKTPLFIGIAEEFLDYLSQERGVSSDDPPYLLELAHYEWVELALAVAESETPRVDAAFFDDPLSQTLRLSELAWPLAYRFPVHRIGPGFQPTEPEEQPTCLVAYRDREDAVRFMEVSPAAYRLLAVLEENGTLAARGCLARVAAELGYSDPAELLSFGADLLRDLAGRGVIGADVSVPLLGEASGQA